MADEGHEATEALIGEVSERVRREYVAAYEEAEERLACPGRGGGGHGRRGSAGGRRPVRSVA